MRAYRREKNIAQRVIQISIALFFLTGVAFPILRMFARITPEKVSSLTASPQFSQALVNSLVTSFLATVVTMALSMAAAFALERTAMKGKAFFRMLLVVPMLIPSISHAFGLVALFGTNGLVTRLLGLRSGIYGYAGIIAGSVMYAFPVALLMFTGILHYEDASPYQAAKVLGISGRDRFFAITLPFLRKTMISVFFAVFSMIMTDYGVPLLIGGKEITLSVLMYNRAVGMLDYGQGSAIGVLLLIPAVIAFVVDVLHPEDAQSAFVTTPVIPEKQGGRDLLAFCFCSLLGVFVIAPIVSFCLMVFATKYPVNPAFTLYHIEKTINRGALTYLKNSLLYAVLTGLLGTLVAFVCAYMTARVRSRFSRALHLLSMSAMAIPGLVLGLSYVIFFSGRIIYGMVVLILMVNTVHFFASPYLMMYNSLVKVNEHLEAVGRSLGIARLRIICDVIVPKVRMTLLEMFAFFFVNSMMTISAVSFLAPPSPKPVALMITQFEAQLLMESAAFVSVMILLVNLVLKAAVTAVTSHK